MKTLVTMALSVMVITGVMAQQKSKQASFKGKNNQEVLFSDKSAKATQAATAEMTFEATDVKSKAEAKKAIIGQKPNEQNEAPDAKNVAAETSTGSDLVIDGTIIGNSDGAEIGTITNVNAEVNSITTGSVTSLENRVNGVVKAAVEANNGLNSHIKSISSDVKTQVKVITDINVKPKSITTRIKAVTGIKL